MTREFAGTLAVLFAISGLIGWASEGFETNIVMVVGAVTIAWAAVVGGAYAVQAWRERTRGS